MIWRCPKCKDETEGPKEPKRNDPCRLCSPCTLRLGDLVRREPARRRLSRRAAKVNPSLQYMWQGMNLRDELHRLVEFCPEHVQLRPPSLWLRHRPKMPRTVGGADPLRHRLELFLWPKCTLSLALATLIHELAHFCWPEDGHGEAFRMAMVELCRDGYGVEPRMPSGRRISKLDHSVEDAMAAWYRERTALDRLRRARVREWMMDAKTRPDSPRSTEANDA